MKRLLCLVAAVLAMALLLTGCSSLRQLTVNDNDTYTDRAAGVTYVPLSPCYEPLSLGAEYASFEIAGMTTVLHTVGEYAPEQVLASPYYAVYCADTLTLPTAQALQLTGLRVYDTATPTIPVLAVDTDEEQGAIVAQVLEAYLTGQRVSYPSYQTKEAAYTLRLLASNLPDLAYCFSYIEYAENVIEDINGVETDLGRYFLYDRYNKICVPVDATLHTLLSGE